MGVPAVVLGPATDAAQTVDIEDSGEADCPATRPGLPALVGARVGTWGRATGRAAPGLALTAAVAVPATVLGRLVPMLGGPVVAIVLGALLGPALRAALPGAGWARVRPGAAVAGRRALQSAVVVLGATLPIGQAARAGAGSLPVMLLTLTVALAGGALLGRALGVRGDTRLLVGVGTGVCGASAIAAVTAVVGAEEASVAYALGTILAFNVTAVIAFPLIGHALGLSQHAFGLWAGTAINDTSSVVAAAYGYGHAAGSEAVVVKLTRSLMIVPICLGLQAARARRAEVRGAGPLRAARQAFPLFILGFLVASVLAGTGVVPAAWHGQVTAVSQFLTAVALAGIGLTLDAGKVRGAGFRPLLLGGVLWVAVALSSLGVQAVTGEI